MRTRRSERRAGADSDDAELIDRARAGETAAFATLYERHGPAVHRLSLASVPEAGADDVTAEVFARAWRSLDRYRGDRSPFRGWLFGIARHVIADTHRRRYRRPTVSLDGVAEPQMADPAVAQLQRLHLLGALESLRTRQRRVIELKYFAGLSNAEVGRELGLSPGAVNTLQWRALQHLRLVLADDTPEFSSPDSSDVRSRS